MLPPHVVAVAQAIYPDAGTLRVHPAPEKLHPPELDRPGSNLVGCLRETMSRFRPSSAAEAALREIAGVENDDLDWDDDDTSGLADWLAIQRVGTIRVTDVGFFVDVEMLELLAQLDKHPRVRNAVSALDAAARLDVAILRLGGIRLGRPISQAVGVESVPLNRADPHHLEAVRAVAASFEIVLPPGW